jgi:hypothetical protein
MLRFDAIRCSIQHGTTKGEGPAHHRKSIDIHGAELIGSSPEKKPYNDKSQN